MKDGKPVLLDLFCGAGGAARGYQQAGFYVIGVDIEPQPHYIGDEFYQADALTFPLDRAGAIHASPPCQRFSTMTARWGTQENHPDLIDPIRQRLLAAGVPWVIENVPAAPMLYSITLCGSMFGIGVRRHRVFETHRLMLAPGCNHKAQGRPVAVYGHAGGSSKRDGISFGGVDTWRAAMQIDWMVGDELAEAIPPAYSEYIGREILEELARNSLKTIAVSPH